MIITHFQTPGITITYDPEWQLGSATMKGFLSSEEFRDGIRQCIQLMDVYKPLRWLADNREMKVIRQADQEWLVAHALPPLLASTIRRNATVVSEDIFNKMAIEQIVKQVDNLGEMLLKEFNNKEQAMAWLKQPIL